MKKFKQQLSKIINKVKNSRSLQIKIAMVIAVLLLYHFLFGDISNRNVEIESAILKNANRESIYSASLENNKLKINKFSTAEFEEEYCRYFDNYHKVRRVLSFDPVVVECDSMKDLYYDVIITNKQTYHTSGYIDNMYRPNGKTNREYKYKDKQIQLPDNSSLSIEAIEQNYCEEFDLKLRDIIEFEPLKVVCGYPDSARTRYITNGGWIHLVEGLDDSFKGQNEQYLLLGDFSLLDKITGERTESFITSIKKNRRFSASGPATISKNKRFFVTHYSDRGDSLAEINKFGGNILLHKFNSYIIFQNEGIEVLTSSHNGNYVFMLVQKSDRSDSRGLVFYIIDVKNKSIFYRKTLERHTQGLRNTFYISNHSDNILLWYESDEVIYAYKVALKNKLGEKL